MRSTQQKACKALGSLAKMACNKPPSRGSPLSGPRSVSYPYRSSRLMSSAVAALLLLTPSSTLAFMASPTQPPASHGLRPMALLKPPTWSWGGIMRGYASRAGRLGLPSLALRASSATAPQQRSKASAVPPSGLVNDELLLKHPKLVTGALPNGFRYCIFNNSKPVSRFYANLEVHAGSVDEEEHERGIAHYLEHMLFLGTEKHASNSEMKKIFTKLGMAYNADANAYTDFRSTVYTLSAPTRGKAKHVEEGGGAALFGGSGPLSTAGAAVGEVEEEETTVEDEASDDSDNVELVLDLLHQMMFKARIEQCAVDSERGAILSEARDRNTISSRVAMDYYTFVHGDTVLPSRFPIGLESLIKTFSSEEIRHFYEKHYNANNMCLYIAGDINTSEVEAAIKRRFGTEGFVRGGPTSGAAPDGPEPCLWEPRGHKISHDFAAIKPGTGGRCKTVSHEQIQDFSVSFSVKEEFENTRTVGNLRQSLVDTIVGFTLDTRIRALRLEDSEPKFQGISWSYTAGAREQCSSNCFSVSALPKFWREAIAIGAGEAKRLEVYGVTKGELHQARTALLNSLAQQANLKDSQSSSSWLSKVMGAVQDGDQMMHPEEKNRVLTSLLEQVSLEEINQRAATLFHTVTEFADPSKARSVAFVSHPIKWEGHVPFSEEELATQLRTAVQNVSPPREGQVPAELLPHEEVVRLREGMKPAVVKRDADEETGVVRGTLSNGLRFSYRKNTQRPNEISVRAVAIGGRALEQEETSGAVVAGLSCWLNGGFGGYSAETIGQFMTMNMLQHDAACHSDSLTFDMKIVTTVPGALNRGLGVFRLLLTSPDFDGKALERFKQRIERSHKAIGKSVERSTAAKFFQGLLSEGDGWKLREMQPSTTNCFTVESVRDYITTLWTADNMEIAISGDLDAEELEEALLTYMGTLDKQPEGRKRPWEEDMAKKFSLRLSGKPGMEDSTKVNDDVVRSFAIMGFPSINRWGMLECDALSIDASQGLPHPVSLKDGTPYDVKMHPNRVMALASEMVTNMLFEEIRTKRGLVYGISFAVKPYKLCKSGIASISFMPKEEQLDDSIASVREVMHKIVTVGFTESDFAATRGPLVTKARESEVTNGLWLMLMEDLQTETNPKDMLSIRRVADHYDAVELEHVNAMVKKVWSHCLDTMYVCVGKSGPGLNKDEE